MATIPYRNRPNAYHPLVGTTQTYRPDLPSYDPDTDTDTDTEGGRLVVAPGYTVGVRSVFYNWNGVAGLDMLYVYCMATGMHTHVTPFDLGLLPLDPEVKPNGGGGEPYGDRLVVPRFVGTTYSDYYVGPLLPAKEVLFAEHGGDYITESVDAHGKHIVVEHRGSVDDADYNQWGKGFTNEEAWRYLIGSDFGPVDEFYDEDHIRRVLNHYAERGGERG